MYWSSETRIPAVADVMTLKQFEKNKIYLHFVDNNTELPKTNPNYDKLFEVRSLIDAVVENCRKIPQEEKHSIDEQILPTKGRSSLKQYLLNKPNKWGIKVWARCGVSGIVYNFEVYCGKNGSKVDEILHKDRLKNAATLLKNEKELKKEGRG